jgi:hypothetical protein
VYDATFSLNIFDPALTFSPLIAKFSFTATGIPSKNDFDAFPAFLFASERRAVSIAFLISVFLVVVVVVVRKASFSSSSSLLTNARAKWPSCATSLLDCSSNASLVAVPLANANCASIALSGGWTNCTAVVKVSPLWSRRRRAQHRPPPVKVENRRFIATKDVIVVVVVVVFPRAS